MSRFERSCVQALSPRTLIVVILKILGSKYANNRLGCKGLGFRDPSIQVIPVMEKQTENKMEHEMETGFMREQYYRDPSIQIILTTINITYIALFGSLGKTLGVQIYTPMVPIQFPIYSNYTIMH